MKEPSTLLKSECDIRSSLLTTFLHIIKGNIKLLFESLTSCFTFQNYCDLLFGSICVILGKTLIKSVCIVKQKNGGHNIAHAGGAYPSGVTSRGECFFNLKQPLYIKTFSVVARYANNNNMQKEWTIACKWTLIPSAKVCYLFETFRR